MPDISMCPGTDCEQRASCYRYKAVPNEYRQAYFVTPPIDSEGNCEMKVELLPYDDVCNE